MTKIIFAEVPHSTKYKAAAAHGWYRTVEKVVSENKLSKQCNGADPPRYLPEYACMS